MKKIEINNCIGCGMCIGKDPEHFEFNSDGLSTVKSNENLDSENLKEAIAGCPVNAISITEDTEEK